MATKRNTPELRFPEFEDEWTRHNLGEIATFSKGKGISKAEISDKGELECIRYGELYTLYGETISDVRSKTHLKAEECVLSKSNDVIIPASGETQLDIATASCVLRSGIALGGDLNIIKSPLDGVFLAYYLNTKKKHEIASLAQGISVVHLYSNQLKTLTLSVPSNAEQNKIAAFLTAVDSKVQLLEKKKGLLQQYKKGVMQKIFSREIRFKDDDGKEFPDWESQALNSICSKKASNISANMLSFNAGDFVVYGAAGPLGKVDFYQVEDPYISIVKDGAGVGRVLLCAPKTSVLGTLDIIKNVDVDLYFLYLLLLRLDFTRFITGSTIPHIYFKDYSKQVVSIPCVSEQRKIASFISAIDDKISHVAGLLEATREYKKGLLQQMFV